MQRAGATNWGGVGWQREKMFRESPWEEELQEERQEERQEELQEERLEELQEELQEERQEELQEELQEQTTRTNHKQNPTCACSSLGSPHLQIPASHSMLTNSVYK